MTTVWSMKLAATDKLVLLALADNASDEGVCWPSVGTLSKKTCLSRRGVQASVARLQKEGHLKRVFRNGHSNNYLVRIINEQIEGAHVVHPPAHTVRPPCAPYAPPPAHVVHPEPPFEPSLESPKNQKGVFYKNRIGEGSGSSGEFYPTDHTFERLFSIAPGWNHQSLLGKYEEHRRTMGPANHPQAAFLGWAKKFTKGNPPP